MSDIYTTIGICIFIGILFLICCYNLVNYIQLRVSEKIDDVIFNKIIEYHNKEIDYKTFLHTNLNREYDYHEFWQYGSKLEDKFQKENRKTFLIQKAKAIQELTCNGCIYEGSYSDGLPCGDITSFCTKYNFKSGGSGLGLRYKYCTEKTVIGPVKTFNDVEFIPEMVYASLYMYSDNKDLTWDGDYRSRPVRVLINEKKDNK